MSRGTLLKNYETLLTLCFDFPPGKVKRNPPQWTLRSNVFFVMNILSFLSENIKNATLFCCGEKVFVISHGQSARPASERKLHQKTFHEIFLKLFSFGQVLQVIISAHHHRSSFALFAFYPLLVLALTWNLTSARYNISCIVVLID